MDPIYAYLFPNHFKGAGQPAFIGKNKEGTIKIAEWEKKDSKGRPCRCIKIEEVTPEEKAPEPKKRGRKPKEKAPEPEEMPKVEAPTVESEETPNTPPPEDPDEEVPFLF